MRLSVQQFNRLTGGKMPEPRKKREKKSKEPVVFVDPGTIIGSGVVEGRAVPWKAPHVIPSAGGGTRTAHWDRDYKRFTQWVQHVKKSVELSMAHRVKRYGGPVSVSLCFYVHGPQVPDVTNMQKAFEDALQGVVFRNDRQVGDIHSRRVTDVTESQRVEWCVVATDTNQREKEKRDGKTNEN